MNMGKGETDEKNPYISLSRTIARSDDMPCPGESERLGFDSEGFYCEDRTPAEWAYLLYKT